MLLQGLVKFIQKNIIPQSYFQALFLCPKQQYKFYYGMRIIFYI